MADIDTAEHPHWFAIFVIALLPSLPACSLVYSAGDFDVPDADMTPDADTSPCADEQNTELTLIDVVRTQVYEGEGCIMEGDACGTTSRPLPLVVRGCNIPADARVTLSGAGFTGTPADTTIGASGRFIGFTIRVPVDTELGKASSEEVTVTINDSDPLTFTLRGLDEFVYSGTAPLNIITAPLDAIYSRIQIDSAISIVGDKDRPARFIATSEIVLGDPESMLDGFTVNANGANATAGTGGMGGPGGCKGGNAETIGECGAGGGKAGMSAAQGNGGGGGGHAEPGNDGGGDAPGPGGASIGHRTLSPVADIPERGQGGGGGGSNGNTVTPVRGGAGGGGGGFIELTSRGRFAVIGKATLSAKGGDGSASPSCVILSGGGGGGGGGGSGGAILVRAAIAYDDQSETDEYLAVDVEGGAGGAGNSCHAGGAGARGRVRMDLPGGGDLPAPIAALPAVSRYRGPVIAPDLPAITTEPTVTVTVYGGLSEDYWIERRTLPATTPLRTLISIQADQSATVDIQLEPGYNELCALVAEDNTPVQPEGRNCLAIAYIP